MDGKSETDKTRIIWKCVYWQQDTDERKTDKVSLECTEKIHMETNYLNQKEKK